MRHDGRIVDLAPCEDGSAPDAEQIPELPDDGDDPDDGGGIDRVLGLAHITQEPEAALILRILRYRVQHLSPAGPVRIVPGDGDDAVGGIDRVVERHQNNPTTRPSSVR